MSYYCSTENVNSTLSFDVFALHHEMKFLYCIRINKFFFFINRVLSMTGGGGRSSSVPKDHKDDGSNVLTVEGDDSKGRSLKLHPNTNSPSV